MATSKYETKWQDAPGGGDIMRLHFRCWYARPKNSVGTTCIKSFNNYADAIAYANSERTNA